MAFVESTLARTLTELHEVADAAALDPARWSDFVACLEERTHGSKIILQILDLRSSRWTPVLSRGFSDRALRDHAAYYAPISPWRDLLLGLKEGQTVWADEHVPIATLHRSEFYNDLLRPEGEADGSTGLNIVSDDHRKASLAVHYCSKHSERMNAVVMPLLRGLSARIRQSLDVNRVLMEASELQEGNASLVRALLAPAAIVNSKGRVLAANDALHDLVDWHRSIKIMPGDLLHLGSPDLQQSFLRRVRGGNRAAAMGGGEPASDMVADYASGALSISILPVRASLTDVRGVAALFSSLPRHLVVLRAHDRRISGRALDAQLVARFQLTPAEVRLVLALERGDSINGLAASLGVSRHTIRAHMKAVFSKTQTNRQVELLAVVRRLIA